MTANRGAQTQSVILYCDGGARGNPGPAGIGAVVIADGTGAEGVELAAVSKYIGNATNNEAEYGALIAGLEAAAALDARTILVRADSELMVRQLLGKYRVKSEKLKPLYARAKALLAGFDSWDAEHVARRFNKRADQLVNEALDEEQGREGGFGR